MLNEQYGDNSVGSINLDAHNEFIAPTPGFSRGFRTEHGAVVLIAVGVLGLWAIAHFFKGA